MYFKYVLVVNAKRNKYEILSLLKESLNFHCGPYLITWLFLDAMYPICLNLTYLFDNEKKYPKNFTAYLTNHYSYHKIIPKRSILLISTFYNS